MRREFARAAATYDAAAVLAREVGERMASRLDYVRLQPKRLMDVGCATGDGVHELRRRYPRALAIAVDSALPMLGVARSRSPLLERLRGRAPRPVNADVRALPLAAGSVGLVWSNLMLHWLDDPVPAFREMHRVLEVDGLLTFSMLGPDTLKELRQSARDLGIEPPLRNFLDMHDIGDMLVAAGFADPVMDMDMITLTYAGARGLLADQHHLGVRDGLLGRLPWREWRRLFRHCAEQPVDGRMPASFEVIYGHAWKAAPRVAADGRAVVHFERTKR